MNRDVINGHGVCFNLCLLKGIVDRDCSIGGSDASCNNCRPLILCLSSRTRSMATSAKGRCNFVQPEGHDALGLYFARKRDSVVSFLFGR